jgi:hypothetical protein
MLQQAVPSRSEKKLMSLHGSSITTEVGTTMHKNARFVV